MKFTKSTNVWYISTRVTCMVNRLNNRPITPYIYYLVSKRGNFCYSVLALEHHGAYVKKCWCYEVL